MILLKTQEQSSVKYYPITSINISEVPWTINYEEIEYNYTVWSYLKVIIS